MRITNLAWMPVFHSVLRSIDIDYYQAYFIYLFIILFLVSYAMLSDAWFVREEKPVLAL